MTKHGDIKASDDKRYKAQWIPCENCGEYRWVRLEKGLPRSRYCINCASVYTSHPCSEETKQKLRECNLGKHMTQDAKAKQSLSLKITLTKKRVGVFIDIFGYKQIYAPQASCAKKTGWALEHRVNIERHLGRPLRDNEIVHHINGIRTDNRIENLIVFQSHSEHRRWHVEQEKKQYV